MSRHKKNLRRGFPGMTRRHFLRGVGGAMMALPFLESLMPRGVHAQDLERPIYSVFMRQGNGVAQAAPNQGEPERFWPRQLGALSRQVLGEQNSDRAVSELSDFADRLLMVRGCNYPFSHVDCGHSSGMAQCLTAARHTGGSANSTMAEGLSADVRIANELSPGTPGLNLVAARITNAFIGANMSYSSGRQRRPAEANPYNVYLDMFAGSNNPEVINRLAVQRNSVNDLVREQMQSLLRRPLSTNDRRRLELHFDSIRDLETTMECNGLIDGSILEFERFNPTGEALDPEGQEYRDLVVDLQMRLIAAAFSCDLVRTAILQIGTGNDQTLYTLNGQQIPYRFHWISHRIEGDGSEGNSIPNAQELHHRIDRKFAQYFRRLLELMDERVTIAGFNLLNDSACVWLNDLADGVGHGRNNLPYVIGGSAGGKLKQGQYVDAGGVTHNKFLNSIITSVGCTNGMGGPVEDFGDSSLEGGLVSEMFV